MTDAQRTLASLSAKRGDLEKVLDRLAAEAGVLMVLLVRRDGAPVLERGSMMRSPETVSPLSSVAMGALETIVAEFGDPSVPLVQAETKQHRLMVVAASEELLVVAVAEARLAAATLHAKLNDAAKAIAGAIAG